MADYTITQANVQFSSHAVVRDDQISGAALSIGQAVVFDTTEGKWYPADADAQNRAGELDENIGIVQQSCAAADRPVTIVIADPDCTPGFTMVVGTPAVVSATAGRIAPIGDLASNHFVTLLLFPTSTTKAILQPIPTKAQKA